MTQWGTVPPEGDQTPDTLADKAKKQPTSVLEFHLEQKRNKTEKAANNTTNLLCFFHNGLLGHNKYNFLGADPVIFPGLHLASAGNDRVIGSCI